MPSRLITGTIDKWAFEALRVHESANEEAYASGSLSSQGLKERMRKVALLLVLLPLLAVAGYAQESRQDASLSVTGIFPPYVYGNTVQQHPSYGLGGLASYRYMLTPRSAIEGNYQYAQYANKFVASFGNTNVHTRLQEISAAYVFNFNFRKFNPFLEGGVGGYLFGPITGNGTNFDAKRTTNIGALYGAGIAYEISPSFDIRAEYRGIVVKAPGFNLSTYKTNRWYPTLSDPAIGVAYHF